MKKDVEMSKIVHDITIESSLLNANEFMPSTINNTEIDLIGQYSAQSG